jgi:HSP20 family protein
MNYRISPLGSLSQINRELNRFFDDRYFPAAPLADTTRWTPSVDIHESEEAFTVLADVPGVKPEDMEISLHKGVLTIRGERHVDKEENESNYSHRERIRGSFMRQFNLPESADEATVTAKSVNGVLEISIPRSKKSQPVNITVQGE